VTSPSPRSRSASGTSRRGPKKERAAARTCGDVAVELDAIDPDRLNQLVHDAIVEHLDPDGWEMQPAVEHGERGLLARRPRAVTSGRAASMNDGR
jgi:hypothetical protein